MLAVAGLIVSVSFMTIAWILSALRRDAGIVDQAWGASVVLVGATYLTVTDTTTWRAILAVVLAGAWGLRLSAHLVWRGRGEPEEWRHRQVRDRLGSTRFTLVSLLTLFWFRALAAVAVSTPLWPCSPATNPPGAVELGDERARNHPHLGASNSLR